MLQELNKVQTHKPCLFKIVWSVNHVSSKQIYPASYWVPVLHMGKEENGVSCPTAPVYSGHSCFPQQISKIMHPLKEQSQHSREHFSFLCITQDIMEMWNRKMQYVSLPFRFWVCCGSESFSKKLILSLKKSRPINFLCSWCDLSLLTE